MRQRADRDEVGARLRVGGDRLERDAARDLDLGHTLHDQGCVAHLFDGHVVEQDAIGAGGARFVDLLDRIAFDLDHPTRPGRPGPFDRLLDTDRGDVIVLDQHRVAQRVAMVEAAARADGRALHRTQPGKGLAGVEHAHLALRGCHVAVRHRRDPTAVTHEVEGGAFAGEDGAQPARDPTEPGPGPYLVAVVHVPLDDQGLVDLPIGLGRERGAGQHAVGAGDEGGFAPLVAFDARDRRDVAEDPEIFGQRVFDETAYDGTGGIEARHYRPRATTPGKATKTGVASPRVTN